MAITYTVQLRYDRTNFLGHGPVRPDGSRSVTFGTTDYLSEVMHFNSYVEALSTAQSKYINLSEKYVIITPFTQPVVKRYEVWITIPCKNGLRTYVLSGGNSFVPLLSTDSECNSLRFGTVAQAMVYMDALEVSDFNITEVDTFF